MLADLDTRELTQIEPRIIFRGEHPEKVPLKRERPSGQVVNRPRSRPNPISLWNTPCPSDVNIYHTLYREKDFGAFRPHGRINKIAAQRHFSDYGQLQAGSVSDREDSNVDRSSFLGHRTFQDRATCGFLVYGRVCTLPHVVQFLNSCGRQLRSREAGRDKIGLQLLPVFARIVSYPRPIVTPDDEA